MSDLQLALLAIGIALVAAVFAYNKWQEARFRRLAEDGFKAGHADVLLHSSAKAAPPAGAARVEPTWAGDHKAAEDEASVPPASAPTPAEGALCEAMDFIIQLDAPAPIAGRALIEAVTPAL